MPETLAQRASAEFEDKQNIKQDMLMGGNLETNTSSCFMSIQSSLCPACLMSAQMQPKPARAAPLKSLIDATNSRPLQGWFPVVKAGSLPAVISVFSAQDGANNELRNHRDEGRSCSEVGLSRSYTIECSYWSGPGELPDKQKSILSQLQRCLGVFVPHAYVLI